MVKRVDPDIKASPEVEQALAGFVPRFGSDNDIVIAKMYGEVKELLQSERAAAARENELKTMLASRRKRRERIAKLEQQILYAIQNRK